MKKFFRFLVIAFHGADLRLRLTDPLMLLRLRRCQVNDVLRLWSVLIVVLAFTLMGCKKSASPTTSSLPTIDSKLLVSPEQRIANRGKANYQVCDGTIVSSGDGVENLRCGAALCAREYQVGTTQSFECNQGSCQITANTMYSISCERLHFDSGCTVAYSPVTACRAP